MIDFHSHILPGIDDGSKYPEMSRRMLAAGRAQGVTIQIATPHFYADRMRPKEFLDRRAEAYEFIRTEAEQENVSILCGAEVAFFRNISEADALDTLVIENTNLLLLEMPFREWTDRDLEEIKRIRSRRLVPVLAHVERFISFHGNKEYIDELAEMGTVMQVNAGSLLHWRTRGTALKLFRTHQAQLLASDCHNMTTRPQNMGDGLAVLEKKLGKEIVTEIDRRGKELLCAKLLQENKELFTAYGQR